MNIIIKINMNKIPFLTFHTGTKIPQLAFGTYKIKGEDAKAAG